MEVRTIKEIRLAKEISKESMANICGVHVNTYTNWEEHQEKIPVGKMLKICEVLNTDINQLVFS